MNYTIETLNFIQPKKGNKGATFKIDRNGIYISVPLAENLGIADWKHIAWAEIPNQKNHFILIGYENLEAVHPQLKPYLLNVQKVKQRDNVSAIKIQNKDLTSRYDFGVIEAEKINVNNNNAILCKIINN